MQYLDAHTSRQTALFLSIENDPIVGLYEGSPDLSQRSEEILLQEVDFDRSGLFIET